jgi:hypothetical protein
MLNRVTIYAYDLADLHGNPAAGISADERAISAAVRYDGYGQTVAAESGAPSLVSQLASRMRVYHT